ncbi:DMT family transporter [Aurantimonas sp. Leaf443]|uniref:DMT family transporter n=1 Tax=Aurantimonas sp. Leaf443 TaxID=1736378 RepID=UPI0007002B07|nr:DMT family transporter [Aurantimonas sp. Leaf443]KQT88256.1 hypothetical protein ASG48_02155 [Aurantimonas sp. Leaf443]
MTERASAQPGNPMFGIALKCISVVVFVGMQVSIKAGGEGLPAGQIVFFRSFFALVPVVAYLLWLGELSTALQTNDLTGHFVRGAVGVVSMACGFFALTRLPYPEWITISYGAPLLTVVFAAIFLKEVIRAYRWTAVAIGLFGIVVVSAPNFTLAAEGLGEGQAIGIAASMMSAVVAAIAMIQIRRLVRTEKTTTIVLYFSLTCSAIALLSVFLGWQPLDARQASFLVLSGLCGGVGQLLLTACYRYADTSTIAPFEYTSMLFAIGIGYFVFGEAASLTTLAGAAIVISAGIFIIWREHRLGIERRKARRVSTPAGG